MSAPAAPSKGPKQSCPVIIAIALVALASCRTIIVEKVVTDPFIFDRSEFRFRGNNEGNGLPLRRDDPDCTVDSAAPKLGQKTEVTLYDDRTQSFEKKSFDLREISGKNLQNPYIEGIFYNAEIQEHYKECQPLSANSNLNASYKVRCNKKRFFFKKPGLPLPICRQNGGYSAESLENAALAILVGILMTGRYFTKVPSFEMQSKIEVHLFPEHSRRHDVGGQEFIDRPEIDSITNNAYFTFLTQNENNHQTRSLIFLNRMSALDDPLWLHPAVTSHEFGHHFFAEIAPKLIRYSQPVSEEEDLSGEANPLESTRHVTQKSVISSFNEGFADLISYYSYHSGIFSWGYLTFANKTKRRNPGSNISEDGKEKVLDATFLKHYFSKIKSRPFDGSTTPDHQDEHTLGAVLANLFNELANEKYGSTQANRHNLQKADLLIKFTKAADQRLAKPLSPKELLLELVDEMVRFTSIDQGLLTREQCRIISKKVPVFSGQILKKVLCR